MQREEISENSSVCCTRERARERERVNALVGGGGDGVKGNGDGGIGKIEASWHLQHLLVSANFPQARRTLSLFFLSPSLSAFLFVRSASYGPCDRCLYVYASVCTPHT